jgi:2,4-dienoyl-CoA reductase-like NADH-dependent reductase (Old Yellow Enzyme family)
MSTLQTPVLSQTQNSVTGGGLFEPLQIRAVTFRNRILVSPMCQYSSVDGFANDWHLVHLGSRAVGGAAAVFVEATAVEAIGRISPGDMGIWKDQHIEPLQRIARFVKQQGAVPGIQLAHAGRKASTDAPWRGGKPLSIEHDGWQPVAPSALAFAEGHPVPKELTVDGIAAIVRAFADAAGRALDAGFELIELHNAHGYLAHEFLSPLSNKRSDQYGGSLENRMRFSLEIVDAVRAVWPERLPLFLRISATDWTAGGWTGDDSVALARAVKERGVDLIDCSSGGNVPKADIPLKPGYQVPFAAQIKHETGLLTGAVGMITEAAQAHAIVRGGDADVVLLAREFLRQPYWPVQAAKELGAPVHVVDQYARAFQK